MKSTNLNKHFVLYFVTLKLFTISNEKILRFDTQPYLKERAAHFWLHQAMSPVLMSVPSVLKSLHDPLLLEICVMAKLLNVFKPAVCCFKWHFLIVV